MIQSNQGISSTKGVKNIVKYISKDNALLYTNNIMSQPDDIEGMTQEILDNTKPLKNSRGKNLVISVTLSLPPDGITPKEQQIQILKNLIDVNEQNRDLKNHLAVIAIHSNDTAQCHAHCVYSANEQFGTKRKRVDKKTFLKQQQALENYRNTNFPYLKKTNHYSQTLEKRISINEGRMKHLRKAITQKDQIKSKIEIAMSKTNKVDFQKYLKSQNLIIYKRGKIVGIRDIDKKRNYRMETVNKGLQAKYIAFEKKINLKLDTQLKQKVTKQKAIQQQKAQERANKIQQTKSNKGRGRGI
ncbi:MAG: hypothetical protein DRG78_04880 [Epsilonproteobacteria bacterium]|nr:MAG: hypothetical protein DRG78_04880 [Campylobacterota bacterium]